MFVFGLCFGFVCFVDGDGGQTMIDLIFKKETKKTKSSLRKKSLSFLFQEQLKKPKTCVNTSLWARTGRGGESRPLHLCARASFRSQKNGEELVGGGGRGGRVFSSPLSLPFSQSSALLEVPFRCFCFKVRRTLFFASSSS